MQMSSLSARKAASMENLKYFKFCETNISVISWSFFKIFLLKIHLISIFKLPPHMPSYLIRALCILTRCRVSTCFVIHAGTNQEQLANMLDLKSMNHYFKSNHHGKITVYLDRIHQKVKHMDYRGGSQKKINSHNEVHTY